MRPAVLSSGALELIGNTPMIRLQQLRPNPKVEIWVKLECHNPGGSVKDRIARSMIEAAESAGTLTRDKVILEATSGNTGIGLALVGGRKGYKVRLAMSEAVSAERRQILAALGADFLLTPANLGTDGAIEVVYRLVRREPGRYFIPDQYNNPANPLAHYNGTAPEIWEQTGGRLTHFVAAMGTSGTLMGISARLKELNPAIRIIGIEPFLGHKIQGLKNMKEAYRPGIFDRTKLDEKVNVADDDAYETTRLLAREEGLFVGMSSGAAVYAALRLARTLDQGLVVALLPDGGERYLSTSLFRLAAPAAQREAKLELFDTLTRARRRFEPIVPGKVSMYSCGPTVNAEPALGLLRRVVLADVLRRTLEWLGFDVRHVMNITDLDDKTINEADRRGLALRELTAGMQEEFLRCVDALAARRAWKYPRASEHVDDMIAFTRRLVERGSAYEKLRSVYFNIATFERYGALSGLDLNKIRVGSTVDLDEYQKDDPRDFTLLKRATLAEMSRDIFFETEWGNVRPGLHVECACMSTRYLGEEFDIHTSGSDLIFPHNENEIAQCEALHGRPPARFWVHSEVVLADGKKMARSAGNAVTLRELEAQGYSGREVRALLLATHHRQVLNYSQRALAAARAMLRRIDTFVWHLTRPARAAPGSERAPGEPPTAGAAGEAIASVTDLAKGFVQDFETAVCTDLNVSMALGALFTLIRTLNPRLVAGLLSRPEAETVLEALRKVNAVLALIDFEVKKPAHEDAAMEQRVREREQARERGDYSEADRIRADLKTRGYTLEDTPEGTLYWLEDGSG